MCDPDATALQDLTQKHLQVQLARAQIGRLVNQLPRRRPQANASQGTDHGTAGPVFVAGAPVKGGFYGDEPSLTDLDHGDLKPTTDFRDVYYELLTQTLQSDPDAVGRERPARWASSDLI